MKSKNHISIISFTANGSCVNEKVNKILTNKGYSCNSFYKGRCDQAIGNVITKIEGSIKEWCFNAFESSIGLIFIGAAAIAVRTIAPFVESKTKDPFVIVIDERAEFVIPILSGHIGGGNELANMLSKELLSVSVITTATDINNVFAVDVFAKKEKLYIEDMKLAKEISARLLECREVGLISDEKITRNIPDILPYEGSHDNALKLFNRSVSLLPDYGILISVKTECLFKHTLRLIPKIITIGVGCKKNTDSDMFENYILNILNEQNISIKAVSSIASIDIKQKEKCIIDFSKKYNIEFITYSAERLKMIAGEFKESEFVKSITGVGNVCERAALAEENREIILKKQALDGITIAIAKEKRGISFE